MFEIVTTVLLFQTETKGTLPNHTVQLPTDISKQAVIFSDVIFPEVFCCMSD